MRLIYIEMGKKKHFVLLAAGMFIFGCISEGKQKGVMENTVSKNGVAGPIPGSIPQIKSDTLEQLKQVEAFLIKFKLAIAKNDPVLVSKFIFFPMQTDPIWMDEEIKDRQIDIKAGLIDQKDFLDYYGKELFDSEQRRILKYALKEEDIHVINLKDDDFSNYYRQFSKVTDPGIPIFTYYLQWLRPDGRGDYWFGLTIGKIKGKFMILSYYSLWPVKA